MKKEFKNGLFYVNSPDYEVKCYSDANDVTYCIRQLNPLLWEFNAKKKKLKRFAFSALFPTLEQANEFMLRFESKLTKKEIDL